LLLALYGLGPNNWHLSEQKRKKGDHPSAP
jgi:hypothetical protein